MSNLSNEIKTAVELHQAETATYLTDAIIGVAFIVLIIIVANMIEWQPGANDKSPAKRRTWFWILGVVGLFVNLAVDFFVWMRHINKVQFTNEYIFHMIIASVASVILYGVVTFLICKTQKKDTKLASIF